MSSGHLSHASSASSMEPINPIWDVLKMGDPDLLTAHIKENSDSTGVNSKNKKLQAPLHHTCETGDVFSTEVLLENKADIDVQDKDHKTPLHCAVLCGADDVVSLLLKHGANPITKDEDGMNSLHLAARLGHHEIAQCIMGDIVDDESESKALSVDKMQMLKEKNVADDTPLHLACCEPLSEPIALYFLDTLCKEAENDSKLKNFLNSRNHDGTTPLLYAICSGCTGVVKRLVDLGCDISIPTSEGRTCLHECMMNNDTESLGVIMESQHKIGKEWPPLLNAYDETGRTALILAAMTGNVDAVKMLLAEESIKVDAHVPGTDPAIVVAYRARFTEIVELLKKAGADASLIEAKNKEEDAKAEKAKVEKPRGDYSGRDATGAVTKPETEKEKEKENKEAAVVKVHEVSISTKILVVLFAGLMVIAALMEIRSGIMKL